MKIVGIVGWSGSGKTTLLTRLLPELTGRGLKVSTIKHAHHGFSVDQPGKDSWQHRQAGAAEVLVSSAERWVLMHERRGQPEATFEELIAKLTPVDLALVEGFKHHPHAKIEIWRAAVGKPLLAASDSQVIAVASDGPVDGVTIPVLDLNDVAAIADFIMAGGFAKRLRA
jgi:molybdopterin-guanine dinucleotide biosynthesis adapter protein